MLLLFWVAGIFSCKQPDGPSAKILSYGIFNPLDNALQNSTPTALGGVTRTFPELPVLQVETDVIPAKIGLNFGINFEFVDPLVGDEMVDLTVRVNHPRITTPDGFSVENYSYVRKAKLKHGKAILHEGFGFELEYEMEQGQWEFVISYKGETLCKQAFKVVRGTRN